MKSFATFLNKHPIAEPSKAPTQLSEGWWFEPTHGFYVFCVDSKNYF